VNENPYEDEGNPFDDIPDVEGYQTNKMPPLPDFNDGGTYEDDFGPDPYTQPSTQPSFGQPQPTTTTTTTSSTAGLYDEEIFPGETTEDQEVPAPGKVPDSTSEEQKDLHVWNIAYYSGYFNVDTKDVAMRITRSLLPFSTKFFESADDNPDLYGPFWIATTLIFVMAASSNFASWWHDHEAFRYDFTTVTFGAAAIYGYIVVLPIALWAVAKWLKTGLALVQIVCIYGYSLFVFIPVSVLCIITYEWLRWLLIGAATGLSVLFLVMNFFPPLLQNNLAEKKKVLGGVVIIGVIALFHLGLGLTFKLYFFDYSTSSSSTSE